MDLRTFRAKVKSKLIHLINIDERLHHWDDERYLKLMFRLRTGKRLHLEHPATYNEKLQWLKLNYRDPATARLVDKHDVKAWVAERIGEDHVIPTLGVYDTVDSIDYDELPGSFVLKTTHDSGGVVLVRDKDTLDKPVAHAKLQRSLGRNYFYSGREPQYLSIQPRIIAEPFVQDSEAKQLRDFKFFCFDGEVKSLYVASDRAAGHVKFDYFDADFKPLNVRQTYPNSETPPSKPKRFDQMREIAQTLSRGFPHVRVDLYEVDGHVYFGEMTFYHLSGLHPFYPARWDRIWGDWLTLPEPISK